MRQVEVLALPNVLRDERDKLVLQAERHEQNPHVFVTAQQLSRFRLAAREWHRLTRDEPVDLRVRGKPVRVK